MGNLIVNDIPITGKFVVAESDGTVIHEWKKGPGDISPDVAVREVVGIHAEHGWVVLEVR